MHAILFNVHSFLAHLKIRFVSKNQTLRVIPDNSLLNNADKTLPVSITYTLKIGGLILKRIDFGSGAIFVYQID